MELNLSELDNVNTMNPYEKFDHNLYEQNGLNYWENPNQKNKETKNKETKNIKKKVSFNDILSNMNLVVNQDGVLQFMAPKQEQDLMYNQQQPIYQEPMYKPMYQQQPMYQKQPTNNLNVKKVKYEQGHQNLPQQNINPEPLDPAVKHSYIYNKYFKDYIDPNANKPSPRVPKTIEEYKRMILEDRIKAIQQKQRIDQIKSKKMFFVSTPGASYNPRNIQASKNNLRSMNFN